MCTCRSILASAQTARGIQQTIRMLQHDASIAIHGYNYSSNACLDCYSTTLRHPTGQGKHTAEGGSLDVCGSWFPVSMDGDIVEPSFTSSRLTYL